MGLRKRIDLIFIAKPREVTIAAVTQAGADFLAENIIPKLRREDDDATYDVPWATADTVRLMAGEENLTIKEG